VPILSTSSERPPNHPPNPQGGRTGFKLKQRRNLLDFGAY
jgi:hypothetical protein